MDEGEHEPEGLPWEEITKRISAKGEDVEISSERNGKPPAGR